MIHMENITYIHVPDFNDSFSRIVLARRAYLIRFTYNSLIDRWRFGLYSVKREPIAVGLPIVPHFILNLQVVNSDFPAGAFAAFSGSEHIRRNDFKENKAAFAFIQEAARNAQL